MHISVSADYCFGATPYYPCTRAVFGRDCGTGPLMLAGILDTCLYLLSIKHLDGAVPAMPIMAKLRNKYRRILKNVTFRPNQLESS
jgi:hypothetical protein